MPKSWTKGFDLAALAASAALWPRRYKRACFLNWSMLLPWSTFHWKIVVQVNVEKRWHFNYFGLHNHFRQLTSCQLGVLDLRRNLVCVRLELEHRKKTQHPYIHNLLHGAARRERASRGLRKAELLCLTHYPGGNQRRREVVNKSHQW